MKKLYQVLAAIALTGVSMTALANLPVLSNNKPDNDCPKLQNTTGSSNGCVSMVIPFGRAATEYEIDLKGYFHLYSLSPSAAVFSPQGLQYYNLFTNKISRNLHQVPFTSLDINLQNSYSEIYDPNAPEHTQGGSPEPSGPPPIYFMDESGNIFPGESVGITDSSVSRYISIFSTNGNTLEFKFKSGDKTAPLSGSNQNDGYVLAMVNSSGAQVATDPVYYDLYMGNGDCIRYDASTNDCVSYILPSGRELSPSMPSVGVEALYDSDGIIRQVYSTRDGLADIVITPEDDARYEAGSRYEIRLYDYAHSGSKDSTTGYYVPNGAPHTVWSIECPIPNQINEVRIVKKVGDVSYSYYYIYNFSVNDWALDYPDNLVVVSKSQIMNGARRTQTTTTKSGSGEVALVEQKIIDSTAAGSLLKSKILDPNGVKLRTDYTYTDDGRMASMRDYSGYWERYSYDDSGRKIEMTSPWKNSAFGSNAEQSKALYYSYAPVYSADKLLPADRRPRKIQEKVLGILTSQTLKAYYTASGCYFEAVQQCPNESSWNSSANLKTIKQYYAKTADVASRGRIWKITRPDNTMDTYSYEYGNWIQAADIASCAFAAGNGNALRVSIVRGTKSSGNGIANQSLKKTIVYDERGNLVQTEQYVYTGSAYERIGWEVISYNSSNKQTNHYYSDGTSEEFTWTCCNMASYKNRSGVQYTYTYDAMQRMIKQIRTIAALPDQEITYTYDAVGNIISETISSDGFSLTENTSYNLAGQKIQSTDTSDIITNYSYFFDHTGTTITSILPGNRHIVQKNYFDSQIASISGSAVVPRFFDYGVEADGSIWASQSLASANGPRRQKQWTNPLSQRVKEQSSGFGGTVTTEYTYNAIGQMERETSTGSPNKLYQYDSLGRLTTMCLKSNTGSSIGLSSADRVMKREQKFEKANGTWFAVTTDSVYGTTNSGTPSQIGKERIQLTGLGAYARIIEQTDLHGNIVTQKTAIDRSAGKIATETFFPHTESTSLQIAVRGLIVQDKRITGETIDYTYDGLDRLTRINNADMVDNYTYYISGTGNQGKLEDYLSNHQPSFTYSYDTTTGTLNAVVDSSSNHTFFAYNDRGQQTRTWGDAIYPMEVAYDEYGQIHQLKTYRTGNSWNASAWPSATPAPDTTTWSYDAASGLVTAKTDAVGNATTYNYTVDGKLSSRTWARKINGQSLTTSYAYNIFNELASVTYPAGTGIPVTSNLTFTYNRLGQPLTVTDAAGTHTFTYNSTFDVQKEAITGSFFTPTLNYTYTNTGWKGNNLNLKLGSDDIYTYVYGDKINGVTIPGGGQPVTIGYTWKNNSGLISQIGIPDMPTTFNFNKGRISLFYFGYSIPDPTVPKQVDYSYNYAYDAGSWNMTSQNYDYSFRDFGWAMPSHEYQNHSYAYNSKSELTSAVMQSGVNDDHMGTSTSNPTVNYNFSYDQIGNRLTANLSGTSWSYVSNSLNQYTALTKSGATTNPTYDADGNLLTCDGWTYTWNMENRLIKAEKGATRLEFNYDYMGRRIEKKVFTGNTLSKHLKFVYDGYKLIAELNGMNDNAQLRRYTWNAPETGLDTPLAMYNVADNTTSYYRAGANKNVMALTSGTDIVAQYAYSPFGTITSQTGEMASVNPFRFSSEYFDDETGLVYYNYRYYNPTLGRWLSRDPIEENGGENLYAFVINQPTNFIDLYGLQGYYPMMGDSNAQASMDIYGRMMPEKRMKYELDKEMKYRQEQERIRREIEKNYNSFNDWYEREYSKIYDENGNIRDDAWIRDLTPCPPDIPMRPIRNPRNPNGPSLGQVPSSIPEGWSVGIFFKFLGPLYHPAGKYELRKKSPNGSHGNQCIYDECGNLISSGHSAGSADSFSPSGYDQMHVDNDVKPFNYIRNLRRLGFDNNTINKLYDKYYKLRPSIYQKREKDGSINNYMNGTILPQGFFH